MGVKKQVRIVYTDALHTAFPGYKGKVFAIIGPFEGHMDKPELQKLLETVLRGYNLKPEK